VHLRPRQGDCVTANQEGSPEWDAVERILTMKQAAAGRLPSLSLAKSQNPSLRIATSFLSML